MPGESYFMALGGLGASLAGFAGLIAALHRWPVASWPVTAWRIRNIVIGGFVVTFAGFGTVAAYAATGGEGTLTARIVSALLAAEHLLRLLNSRPGPEWPSETNRRYAFAFGLVETVVLLANVVVGSLPLLQVLLLVELSGPTSIFINTVRDIARAPAPAGDDARRD